MTDRGIDLDRHSFQFFDEAGVAVHKVFLQEASAQAAFEALVSRHLHEDQSPILRPASGKPAVGFPGFPKARNPHRLWRVEPVSLGGLLLGAAAKNLQLQYSVASPGALQTLWGPAESLQRRGPWLQVLDPAFNLALDLESLGSAWVTQDDGEDEGPYRLQLLDARDEAMAELRGATPAWNDLLYALPVPEA